MGKDQSKGPPWYTEPASIISQLWTLGAIAADRRTKGRHLKVAYVIVDRFIRKFGHGLASVRYLQRAVGLSPRIVMRACSELVQWGYFKRTIGSGKRPSEFTPNWVVKKDSVAYECDGNSVSRTCYTHVTALFNGNADSVSSTDNESCLGRPTGLPKAGENGAARSDGLTAVATAASEKQNLSFEELWIAFPRKHNKRAARIAYETLAPDATRHAEIMGAARALATHHQEHNTPPKYRKQLHNWIASEGWTEELPVPYGSAKSKEPSNDGPPAKNDLSRQDRLSPTAPIGRHEVEITAVESLEDDSNEGFRLSFQICGGKNDGRKFDHQFIHFNKQEGSVDEGSNYIRTITDITGDHHNLSPGTKLTAVITRGGKIQYRPFGG